MQPCVCVCMCVFLCACRDVCDNVQLLGEYLVRTGAFRIGGSAREVQLVQKPTQMQMQPVNTSACFSC